MLIFNGVNVVKLIWKIQFEDFIIPAIDDCFLYFQLFGAQVTISIILKVIAIWFW